MDRKAALVDVKGTEHEEKSGRGGEDDRLAYTPIPIRVAREDEDLGHVGGEFLRDGEAETWRGAQGVLSPGDFSFRAMAGAAVSVRIWRMAIWFRRR